MVVLVSTGDRGRLVKGISISEALADLQRADDEGLGVIEWWRHGRLTFRTGRRASLSPMVGFVASANEFVESGAERSLADKIKVGAPHCFITTSARVRTYWSQILSVMHLRFSTASQQSL